MISYCECEQQRGLPPISMYHYKGKFWFRPSYFTCFVKPWGFIMRIEASKTRLLLLMMRIVQHIEKALL